MNPSLNLLAPDTLPRAHPTMDSADFPVVENVQAAAFTQLIQRMAAGDEAALSRLYDLTLARVYALALRITSRHDLAEEVCIEAYWQAWREAGRYDSARGEPLAWLMMMARSRALDALRRQDRATPCPDPETLFDNESAPDTSPLDCLLAAERASALGRALAQLTPIQRQMVGLAFYRDLSHQEISNETGLPLGTVKSHLKRAQDTLRIALCQA
ncbi:MAG: sigma-70 family RNA polymerase sigma factor [Thiobacillus sp.]|nr:sigma-70 family RNA polymerase sigma factor [Thiobacillus sp.]